MNFYRPIFKFKTRLHLNFKGEALKLDATAKKGFNYDHFNPCLYVYVWKQKYFFKPKIFIKTK